MDKNIIKNPISINDISEGDNIVIYHSGSNPEYIRVIRSVSITQDDNLIRFRCSETNNEDVVHSKFNWISIGRLSDFNNISWNEKKFIGISNLELNYPYYMVVYDLNKIPSIIYEVIMEDKSDDSITINHNPYREVMSVVNGKKYYKLTRNGNEYLVSLIKSL